MSNFLLIVCCTDPSSMHVVSLARRSCLPNLNYCRSLRDYYKQWYGLHKQLLGPPPRPAERLLAPVVHRGHQRPLLVRVHPHIQAVCHQLEGVDAGEGQECCEGCRTKGDPPFWFVILAMHAVPPRSLYCAVARVLGSMSPRYCALASDSILAPVRCCCVRDLILGVRGHAR